MSDFENEISELLNSNRCEHAFEEINSKYSVILDLTLPFKDDVGVRQYRNRMYGGFDYNDITTQQALNKYETLKPDLIDKVVQCCDLAAKEVEKIFGLLPFSFTSTQIRKYVVEREKERYQWHVRPSGPDKYGIYFMMPDTLNRIGHEYFEYILPYYISAMRDAIKSKQQRAIKEKEKEAVTRVISSTKVLIIFDYDGTVFDTDRYRIKRSNRQFNNIDYSKIHFIEGFEDIFLKEESKLFLGKHLVVGITSSPGFYADQLLKTHQSFSKHLTYETIETSEKLKDLEAFLKKHRDEYGSVIAFGDDEKDACIYSLLGLPFYIVNNYYGYEPNVDDIIAAAKENKTNQFRRRWLHDVKKPNYRISKRNFSSRYFDDVVIYYRNYLDTYRFDYSTLEEKGSFNAPSQRGIEPLKVYKGYELGKSKKNDYILSHIDELAKLFDDIPLGKNSVLVKFPSHNETEEDSERPMRKLINRIAERHGLSSLPPTVLLRKTNTGESKEGDRFIEKHLDTVYVTEQGARAIRGKTVYLIDDIITSGASIIAGAELLYEKQAGHVVCLCIARTCGDGDFLPIMVK